MTSPVLIIPEAIPSTARHGSLPPRRLARAILADSAPMFRRMCEQIGGVFRPMPAMSASLEEKLSFVRDLIEWLGQFVEIEPWPKEKPTVRFAADLSDADRELLAREILADEEADSKYYNVRFTPASKELVVACGFVTGEIIRSSVPYAHWEIIHDDGSEPHVRFALKNFRCSNGFDPRRNYHNFAWHAFAKRDLDGRERVIDMAGLFMKNG